MTDLPPLGLPGPAANRPGANDRQRPPRRVQMANAAAYVAQLLEQTAEQLEAGTAADVDPAQLRQAAAGLAVAVHRFTQPKPPRQSRPLPRRGRLTNAGRDVTPDQLLAAAIEAAQSVRLSP